jgi:CP family cyanate transporter-like MFS transporter
LTLHHSSPPAAGWPGLSLLWLIGLNLRLSVLALPPLVPLIHHDLGLSQAAIAALAGLPLLLFGLGAIPGALAIARWGAARTVLAGLLLIGLCAALRGFGPSIGMLFGATVGLGAAIAVTQPALPALVREWYPTSVTRATGGWSNGLLMGTILSAALSLPLVLPLVGGSWSWTMVVWAAPALIAAGWLALALRTRALSPARPLLAAAALQPRRALPDWRDQRVWQIGMLQAAATLGYFGASTFIPDYLAATGRAELNAAALAGLSLGQLPASLLVGLVPWSGLARRRTALALASTMVGALAVLVVAPGPLFVLAAAVLGGCSAATLVIALALPPILAAPTEVPRLAAGVLAVGYSTVWLGLLVTGAIWDATHVPGAAFGPAALAGGLVLLLGPRLLESSRRRASAGLAVPY